MEQGTEREREAVREAWDAIAARRARTDALLLGGVLVGSGLLIVAFALLVPLELCVHGAGIDGSICTTQQLSREAMLLALIVGGIMTGGGGHLFWQNLHHPN
ncbi:MULTISPECIES: hypothetical protein [Halococcus]|uniref:Uncharacterized protein n=1 Tax=Halococcus salifodinae DSM 8989 TaxID=1227456 RepID=M0NCF2_9EURY|nr:MULTISPECIES: hypothetical protein [Halococcus]EMA55501.1 hypothetical protein C450_02004 [Halococcus salifodinae DSM 8989]